MKLSNEVLDASVQKSSDELLNLSKKIKEIKFPEPVTIEIELSKLNDAYITDVLNEVPAGYAQALKDTDFIYIFTLKKPTTEIKKQIFNGLSASRDLQALEDFEGKRDFCRVNNSESEYLYVGRSQKLKSRLKQHLDAGSEGIFAMHMLRWGAGINATLEINYYRFDKKSNLIVQALEDGLWDQFTPMFGRQGEK
ncbi:hypothetical protein [Microbulbifer sp. ZKSA002]|uniref:hypothetical protein n=1 Tax=Microbulbifer sp. ZKSA002 TaxID=3243388 RepID=UPI00403979F8